jgi:hypothetical protein
MSEDGNNNKEKLLRSLKTVWETASYYKELYDSFVLKKKIEFVREEINSYINTIPFISFNANKTNVKEKVFSQIQEVSERLNSQNPYFSSLCRSHGTAIVSTAGFLVAFPLKSTLNILKFI